MRFPATSRSFAALPRMKRFLVVVLALAGCAHNNSASGDDAHPGCGDGRIGGTETCGDGGITPSCGDGILEPGEGCDDGNTTSGDGCSSVCQPESTGLPCTANTFRCGPSGDVEVCNNAGTAWQYVSTCDTGCNGGACTDATCQPNVKRCHGETVETCNAGGTGWNVGETCTTYCASGQCALPGLTVGANSNYDGQVIVAGDLVITGNSTLTSSGGDLTIIADNIRVEAGAAIAVAPTGTDRRGQSCSNPYALTTAYGTSGAYYSAAVYGGDADADVDFGSLGGVNGGYACSYPDLTNATSIVHGGGRMRLIAKHDITIAGQLLAPGQDGVPAGSGGGIQIAGDTIEITGSISTPGGAGGSHMTGAGRVRLLYGKTLTNTGTIIGKLTSGLRPPIDLRSATAPDSTLLYNDGFATLSIAHERSFDTAQGYLHTVSATEHEPPQPAQGTFSAVESFDIDATKLVAGTNWVHLAALDANSTLGTVESRFLVNLNTTVPSLGSTSHTTPTTWYDNANPYFQWTNPQGAADRNWKRTHYVFDHFGDTIPTIADTSLVMAQKNLLVSNVAAGIWVLHVITEDTRAHLTSHAAHAVIRVGTDPGSGTVFGSVFDENNHPVAGAVVRVNRGLFTATTSSAGAYSLPGVAAGTWEISVVYAAHHASAQQLTVAKDQQASASFNLAHN